MRNLQRAIVKACFLGSVFALLFAWLGVSSAHGQTSPAANPKQPSMAASQAGGGAIPEPQKLPDCPKAGVSPLEESDTRIGHHKVILNWNANVETGKQKTDTVGYCLYRSEVQTQAKQNALCDQCEQINKAPVTGTSCTDYIVKDSTKYYYVVVGINASGKIGSSSEEVVAPIPAEGQPGSDPSTAPVPARCRKSSP